MPSLVAEAMVTRPTVHEPSTTVAQLRAFFGDDHVHMALIVDRGTLIGAVERADLTPLLDDDTPASSIARLGRRTVSPDALLPEVFDAMRRTGRRRLAVTRNRRLLGLLCLKASGRGFCSDADTARRGPRAASDLNVGDPRTAETRQERA